MPTVMIISMLGDGNQFSLEGLLFMSQGRHVRGFACFPHVTLSITWSSLTLMERSAIYCSIYICQSTSVEFQPL